MEASNPLQFEGFDARLAEARERTKLKSGCITFEAKLDGTKMIVALFAGTFRGGSVGSAEGTKFVEAAELAMKKRYPLLAYVHGTAGIRIQEGTHGVIQMPRCTVAVRRYINAGGLYTVLYDTNSYAGRWRASSAARPTSTPCAPRTSGSPDAASSRKPRA